MTTPETCCVVFATVGSREEAERIAAAVVEERLAACCNLVPGVCSVYRWKGAVHRDDETLMILKTRRSLFESLRARIKSLHSYEVPEIIALPLIAGHADYLNWVEQETAP